MELSKLSLTKHIERNLGIDLLYLNTSQSSSGVNNLMRCVVYEWMCSKHVVRNSQYWACWWPNNLNFMKHFSKQNQLDHLREALHVCYSDTTSLFHTKIIA